MKIRKKCPQKNNKYYNNRPHGGLSDAVNGYPMISGLTVLDNCVGWANSRFNEIINDPDLEGIVKAFKYQLVCNAEIFIESAKRQGLKISSTPIEGGIIVWQKGSTLRGGDGAGHVAVVERVYDDGSILTSESGWASWTFKNVRRYNDNGRWGQNSAYRFRGCIINPAVKNPKVVPAPKLTIDGIGGACTVRAMQRFFGVAQDGVISGQNKDLKEYYPSLTAVEYGSGGSITVKKLQKWVGAEKDGVLGEKTVKKWQKKLGLKVTGKFCKSDMKVWQEYLNNNEKAVYPRSNIVIDVSEFQSAIDWDKVKADGIQGVIVRCGYRGAEKGTLNEDSMFLKHIKSAYKAGLKVGIYFFTQAITADEGAEEAVYAVKLMKKAGVPVSYPIAIDSENVWYTKNGKRYPGRANGLTKAKRTDAIKGFCDKIKALGYDAMIYASTSWFSDKLNMSKLPYDVWVAQYASSCEYKGKYIMWQYTSSGKVSGVKGDVDVNRCYLSDSYSPVINADDPTTPPVVDEKKGYDGTLPSLRIKKSNQEVIDDAVAWAKWIAHDNDFHYGACNQHDGSPKPKKNADKKMCSHHNGCYFCGTNKKMKSDAMTDKEKSYCCNPFLGAAWAHGGCVPKALSMCQKGDSWDFGTGGGSYHKSPLFDNLGKIAKSKLKKGDILCLTSHVKMYIGDGKCVEAGHRDDNVKGSDSWNDSIAIHKVGSYDRVYRFNGSVDTEMPIRFGEISDRVKRLQKFLKWCGYDVEPDRIFGEATLKAVKKFQKEHGLTADGVVGEKTLAAMRKVVK